MKAKRSISNFLQFISFLIIVLIAGVMIYMNTPGNGEMCDPDRVIFSYVLLVGVGSLIVFLFCSINDLIHKHQPTLRKILIGIIGIQFILIITIDPIFSAIKFDELKMKAEYDFPIIKLNIYENGTFFYRSFNNACSEEFYGQYKIEEDKIELIFIDDSDYLTNNYIIVMDSLKPINTDYLSLKIK